MDILISFLHNLMMPKNRLPAYARYLPTEAEALRWGFHVVDGGFSEIPPGSVYPPGRERHPAEYMFSWEQGRSLNEYQLVYITRGRGLFESDPTGRVRIEAGHVFLLFPGIWHRYRPLKPVGWDENWIGFGGEYADRIMRGFFPAGKAVIRTGCDESLLLLIRTISELMQEAPPGYQQLLAARTIDALARVRSLSMGYSATDREKADKIQQARNYLLAHSDETIDMPALAKKLGMSYSGFRCLFKAHTGIAPHRYQIDIRINKARRLLAGTGLSVTEIADRLCFSSVFYFSRLLKQKTGLSPMAYRERHAPPG